MFDEIFENVRKVNEEDTMFSNPVPLDSWWNSAIGELKSGYEGEDDPGLLKKVEQLESLEPGIENLFQWMKGAGYDRNAAIRTIARFIFPNAKGLEWASPVDLWREFSDHGLVSSPRIPRGGIPGGWNESKGTKTNESQKDQK